MNTAMLGHATSEIALPREIESCQGNRFKSPHNYRTGRGSKLGIDATKKLPSEGFKRSWPPLIKMDEGAKAKVEKLFHSQPTMNA